MKKNYLIRSGLFMLFIIFLVSNDIYAKPKKVLVFSKTAGFRHGSAISAGKKVIEQLGKENSFEVDTTEDASVFTSENLQQYAAIIFLCTTGDVLNVQQQQAFERYISSGGGFVGTHSATDTEYYWPWYGELVGAYFKSHPPKQQGAVLNVVDPGNIATAHLPRVWKKTDELYNFKWIGQGLNILITLDENSYKGGENGEFHPMSWYHEYSGGRAFYTAFGHDKKSFEDPLYVKHLLGGIKYAMGAKLKQMSASN
ncbi:ThuA domain-containing protein [Daejeonella sp.]|uniref:ThuA domain-containing protein n=1 Tax=Daejeonella sp. TaxID=2805397 RepID=UPI003983A234